MSVILTIRVYEEDKRRFRGIYFRLKAEKQNLTEKELFKKMLDVFEEYLSKQKEVVIW